MKLRNLIEEWADSIKDTWSDETIDIFVNPSRAELRKLPKDVRFLIVLDTKKIYVFDTGTLHHTVERKLKLKNTLDYGMGIIRKAKIKPYGYYSKVFKINNSWLEKYLIL